MEVPFYAIKALQSKMSIFEPFFCERLRSAFLEEYLRMATWCDKIVLLQKLADYRVAGLKFRKHIT